MDKITISEEDIKKHLLVWFQKRDKDIISIFKKFGYGRIYERDGDNWKEAKISGPMYILQRSSFPVFKFKINNRNSKEDFELGIDSMDCELSSNYVYFKSKDINKLYVVWFEKEEQATSFCDIVSKIQNGVYSESPVQNEKEPSSNDIKGMGDNQVNTVVKPRKKMNAEDYIKMKKNQSIFIDGAKIDTAQDELNWISQQQNTENFQQSNQFSNSNETSTKDSRNPNTQHNPNDFKAFFDKFNINYQVQGNENRNPPVLSTPPRNSHQSNNQQHKSPMNYYQHHPAMFTPPKNSNTYRSDLGSPPKNNTSHLNQNFIPPPIIGNNGNVQNSSGMVPFGKQNLQSFTPDQKSKMLLNIIQGNTPDSKKRPIIDDVSLSEKGFGSAALRMNHFERRNVNLHQQELLDILSKTKDKQAFNGYLVELLNNDNDMKNYMYDLLGPLEK